MYTGIYSERSNYTSTLNQFHLIYKYFSPTNGLAFNGSIHPEVGSGIFYRNSRTKTKKFGGYLIVSDNKFIDIYRGIRVSNSPLYSGSVKAKIDISNNNYFDNSTFSVANDELNDNDRKDIAIQVEGVICSGTALHLTPILPYENILIDGCNIVNFAYGIKIRNTAGSLNILSNNINTTNTYPHRYLKEGITISAHSSFSTVYNSSPDFVFYGRMDYMVDNNCIGTNVITNSNPRIGIWATSSGYGTISNNKVYSNSTSSNRYGIVSSNSPYVTISNNPHLQRVTNVGAEISSLYANTVAGILIENSFKNTVCGNSIFDYSTGLLIKDYSPFLITRCNDFNYNRIRGVGIINANFGDQGTISNPSDNEWIDFSSSTKRIQGNLNSVFVHSWYYRNGLSTSLGLNSNTGTNVRVLDQNNLYSTFSPLLAQPINLFCSSVCLNSSNKFGETKSLSTRDSLFSNIIYSIDPDTLSISSDFNNYSRVRSTFLELAYDSSWLHTNDSSDSLYIQFLNKCSKSNIGKQFEIFRRLTSTSIDSMIVDSLETIYYTNDSLLQVAVNKIETYRINDALTSNNSLLIHHEIENTFRKVYEVFGNSWAKGKYELSAEDSSLLNSIAFQSPWTHGEGVYMARMMLDTIYINEEPQIRIGREVETETIQSYTHIYPNPSVFDVNIHLADSLAFPVNVLIYDLSGRIIFHKIQTSSLQNYSIADLASGTYIYELNNQTGVIQRGKFVVSLK
jgi:hypothetical protein